ncbi:hypothetical protein SB778_36655, partial [Paraburkholderia sp. SIMBA_050]
HATVQKALRILLVGEMQKGNAPQPHPPGLEPATHPKVKRAILLMEQHVGRSLPLEELACKLDMSTRQLERLFKAETGRSPQAFAKQVPALGLAPGAAPSDAQALKLRTWLANDMEQV